MKSKLSYYKERYRNAVKQMTKNKVMNSAMLNLTNVEFTEFIKWQTNLNK
jgi:hypothetical protein